MARKDEELLLLIRDEIVLGRYDDADDPLEDVCFEGRQVA